MSPRVDHLVKKRMGEIPHRRHPNGHWQWWNKRNGRWEYVESGGFPASYDPVLSYDETWREPEED